MPAATEPTQRSKERRFERLTVFVLALLLCCPLSCSSVDLERSLPLPPSETTRAGFGRLSLVLLTADTRVDLHGPTSGKPAGAGKGVSLGITTLGSGISAGSGESAAMLAVAIVLLLPLLAIGGAVYGSTVAQPADLVREAEAVFVASFDVADFTAELLARTALEAERAASVRFVAPAGPVDSRVELGVMSVNWVGDGIDPPLRLRVTSRCRVLRTQDGELLHELELTYLGGEQKLLAWAADHGSVLRDELELAAETLAVALVEELFLVHYGGAEGT